MKRLRTSEGGRLAAVSGKVPAAEAGLQKAGVLGAGQGAMHKPAAPLTSLCCCLCCSASARRRSASSRLASARARWAAVS